MILRGNRKFYYLSITPDWWHTDVHEWKGFFSSSASRVLRVHNVGKKTSFLSRHELSCARLDVRLFFGTNWECKRLRWMMLKSQCFVCCLWFINLRKLFCCNMIVSHMSHSCKLIIETEYMCGKKYNKVDLEHAIFEIELNHEGIRQYIYR